LFRIQGDWFLS